MLVSWLVFPLLLSVLALGCGLLLERAAGTRLPAPLLPGVGLALIVVVGQVPTLTDGTSELTSPITLSLAIIGFGLGGSRLRGVRIEWWAIGVAFAVYVVYLAPVMFSGHDTFAGIIKLDDTATWLAFTDQVMEHGRDFDGLAPSTYETLIQVNFPGGYPIGSFLALGVGGVLTGQDLAWVFQPYLAWLGALLGLCIYGLLGDVVMDRRLRAAGAFIAAQAALLVGYSLWGGIKELATAPMLALAAGLLPLAFASPDRGWRAVRAMGPLAIASVALFGVIGTGAIAWVAPIMVGGAAGMVRVRGWGATGRSIVAYVLAAALPAGALLAGGFVSLNAQTFTSQEELGNLLGPLSSTHIFGIWAASDFRVDPGHTTATHVLIAFAVIAGILGVLTAIRSRAWALLAYVGAGLLGTCLVLVYASPWVDAKALAITSPAALTAAVVGALALMARRRAAGLALFGLIAVGVLWSNALQYRSVNLAPWDQLDELEEIGKRSSGQGPTLITESQIYGARHFLRRADAEAASELRRREIPLRNGETVQQFGYANLDRFPYSTLNVYRTLVLRRSPFESRPPFPYQLIFRGRFYEAWARDPATTASVVADLPLGGESNQGAQPDCAKVERLAGEGAPGKALIAAPVPYATSVSPSAAAYPAEWGAGGDPDKPFLVSPGKLEAVVRLQQPGTYEVWLEGSWRGEIEISVDGVVVGRLRHHLTGLYTQFGSAQLDRGDHLLEVSYSGPDLHPGSKGGPFPAGDFSIGRIVLRLADTDPSLVTVPVEQSEALCGRTWDWIEVQG
jgi:hypothetical protein